MFQRGKGPAEGGLLRGFYFVCSKVSGETTDRVLGPAASAAGLAARLQAPTPQVARRAWFAPQLWRKIVLRDRSSRDTPVAAIMTAEVVTVTPADTVEDCLQLVTDRRIRHLPVVEGAAVLGVISIGDLVKSVIEQQRRELGQLQQYIVGG